jgi:NTP pyrophosphatase (non-canonical NTP hydrolase)
MAAGRCPDIAEGAVEIGSAQKLAWDNKVAKGFNITDVAMEFGLLTAEVGEAFTAWRRRLPDLGEELADVFIYLASLAEMTGLDLDAEVQHKIAKNASRTYQRDAYGVLTKEPDKPGKPGKPGKPDSIAGTGSTGNPDTPAGTTNPA